jgi:pimeloyl-ACP methyl ester carboxylesterase
MVEALPAHPDWPGRDQSVRLADGRRLALRHYGVESGIPLLMLHGTPASRIMFAGMDAPARLLGIHVIALDRWAYGGSDAPPTPSLAGFAADVGTVMTDLGIVRFAVAGVSGGGPYAAAVATLLVDRVDATALISPVGLVAESIAAGEVSRFHRFCFQVLPHFSRVVTAMFAAYAMVLRRNPKLASDLTTARAPAVDRPIIDAPAVSARIAVACAEALRVSARGPAIDLALFREIDQLPFAQATMPVQIWMGSADTNVPVQAARRLAKRWPGAVLVDLEGHGHMWIAEHYDVVLQWVLTAAAQSAGHRGH